MKSLGRRDILGAAAGAAAAAMIPGCSPSGEEPQTPAPFEPGGKLPWVNWGGNQFCHPAQRLAPASEDELVSSLKQAAGTIRAVGAGHSFSAVVPTDGTLIATELMNGLLGKDDARVQAEIWAGTRLHDLGPLLDSIGQALPNMPDIDYPALGGAIATSAHATGQSFGSMSSYVVALTLATPSGELLKCSPTENPAIFQSARVSVGALGIVARITLQNQPAFRLTEVNRVEKTEDVLADLDARVARHLHFEFMPLTNSDLAVTIATDPAKPGDRNSGEDDPQAVNELRRLHDAISWLPGGGLIYDRALKIAMGDAGETVRTGPSFEILPHVRVVRFREMEYTVPQEAGPACLREILRTIRERRIPVCFPLEYRHVAADDIWLSMFEGRAGASISVHQFGDLDYRRYFAEIEPIFWKYDGRPHWGKLHTLDAARLATLYPRHWKDFHEVRRTLDPDGRMLNPHLTKVFGA